MAINKPVYTVSDVNRYVKALVANDDHLKYILVKGEISNFKPGANGHLYFSLKDKESLINVAMFNSYARSIDFAPENGQEVVLLASVDVYPARGTYQLIAYEMHEVGRGDILLELEKLKQQLLKEGLFDVSRKRPINIYPKAIGVITAKNSAAIKDILFNIKRRYPLADVYVFYSAVQGESAPKELLAAFNKAQEYDLDTLIIGRGGGASEDLSAFNDETLVRAVANSKMPVIAAVGHEVDSTLIDFVADKRASTPTGAAELATVDIREIEQKFQYAIMNMQESIYSQLSEMKQDISFRNEELNDAIKDKIDELKNSLENKKNHLSALNPKSILSRGYSITSDESGHVIMSRKDVKAGMKIRTSIKDGTIVSEVKDVED